MQLEGARAELRARPDHEAADLGVLLLRALFRPALRAWLGFVLPLQLLVLASCSPYAQGFSYLAIWWLKPVYDRAFGLVLGRGLFGDAPGLRQLYRALWSDGKRGLLGDLLWRRLDPARSLVAPVALLEGLKGKAARRRRRTLGESSRLTVALLMAACLALELAMLAGLFVGCAMLLPEHGDTILDSLSLTSQETLRKWQPLALYVLAVDIVEPLFVAAGFGLYINRRTNIEGWDIELTFRRMARRLAASALLGLLISPLLLACPVSAQPAAPMSVSALDEAQRLPAPTPPTDGEAAASMERVLARPELQRTHIEERWQLRKEYRAEASTEGSLDWLGRLAGGIAGLIELLLWLLAGLAVVVVVYLLLQRIQRTRRVAASGETLPAFVATIRDGAAGAPALALHEVVPAALARLAQGEHVAALSLLYVGTLSALVAQDGLSLPRQATEGQCLDSVRRAAIALDRKTLFEELTQAWQLSAYAHATPEEARLRQICARFSACFGAAS